MKTKIVFLITFVVLLSSCSEQRAKKIIEKPRVVVNNQLDAKFALMIDAAKNHFIGIGDNIQWEDPAVYERDSVGNRIIHASYNVEGIMSGMKGRCIIKIEQVHLDTVITQSIPYTDGSLRKSINKLKKGEIIVLVDNFIFAHSDDEETIPLDFIKVLEEQVFAYNSTVLSIKAQMN